MYGSLSSAMYKFVDPDWEIPLPSFNFVFMKASPPIILSIAGSDPSGGAGIQADIKAISALGGYAAAAITAITVQNTRGVAAVEYLSPDLIARQVESVMEDLHPVAVKIGMTGTASIVRAIAEVLRRHAQANVVLDPVLVSTSGRVLTQRDAVEAMCTELLPLCRVATPNLDEAALLIGQPIESEAEMAEAARTLQRRYGCAFLVKGGHLSGATSPDLLVDDGQLTAFTGNRIETRNLHGTGCTLSSAIATALGFGNPLPEAVRQAKDYMERAIVGARNWHVGEGNGPLCHFPKNDSERRG